MTRKERAVEILKNELACVRNVDCERSECRNCNLVMPEHDITEALQMSIKALEQEPCEDAISRQAVMDNLCDGCELFRNGEQACFTGCEEYHFLVTLPPVEPQQKIGQWIKSRDCYGNNHFTCSFCGNDIATKYDGIWKDNYCSNCGAKMQESEG